MSIYDKASLVLIPSGTKTSKVYSQKPTNGDGDFTFSRSTAATRVNASGNIEKETQNLMPYSNQFNQWPDNTGVTETGGQAGYDGTNDAWKITLTSNSGSVRQLVTHNGVYTFSVYAKAGNKNWLALYLAGTPTPYVYFDLANGVLGSNVGNNAITSKIEDAGSGWYRCSVIYNANITGTTRIFPADSNGVLAYANDYIYIQDAQLEQGLVARDVITTTTTAIYGGITDNVPRLDYTDSSCPALLLEPQRTNVVPQSEYLGGWSAINCSLTANSITSPEGVINSFKITENSAASTQHRVAIGVSSTSAIHTMSAYVKNSSGSRMAYIDMGPVTGHFNFATETMYSAQGTANWEDAGNGWYRISITSNTAVTPVTAFAGLSVNNSETYSGDGSSAIEFYGIQLEAGSYATSYIPTYGSAVTRNEESGVLQNMIDNGVGSSGAYSVLVEVDIDENPSGSNSVILFLGQNQNLTDVEISLNSYEQQQSGRIRLTSATDGTITYLDSPNTRRYAFAVDGTSVISTDESGVTTDTLSVDGGSLGSIKMSYGTSNRTISMFKQLIIVPSALSSAELLAFTQS